MSVLVSVVDPLPPKPQPHTRLDLEAEVGIEPTDGAFAEPCLTTWLLRRTTRWTLGRHAAEVQALFTLIQCDEAAGLHPSDGTGTLAGRFMVSIATKDGETGGAWDSHSGMLALLASAICVSAQLTWSVRLAAGSASWEGSSS